MTEYLASLNHDNTDPLIEAIREKAAKQNVPIIKTETLAFIEQLALIARAKRVLEIGGAIGYFAIQMARSANVEVTSIEIDPGLAKLARENISEAGLKSAIELITADALEVDPAALGTYDIIFVDGAKGKYRSCFLKFKHSLKQGGFFVFDNLLFRGQVAHPETILSRNRRQLVNKIKGFNEFIMNQEDFLTRIYPLGDGVAVAIKTR